MGKYKDIATNDKFEILDHELKEIEKEKCEILKLTIDKEMSLDSLITKSENLKRTVLFFITLQIN